jgi:hypothetical protein
MNIHIITPFYRKALLPTLIHYLKPMDIIWHPVCDPVDIEVFENNTISWIKPLLCTSFLPTDMCYRKINDFIESENIIDDDYYGFMGDDDMYEPGFIDVIREQTAKILIYSLYRGNVIPECDTERHPPMSIVINSLDEIQVCNIGLGMYIMKGEILRQTKFQNNHIWDDGRYAEELKARWPDDIKLLPDLYIFGNYFQPGRYTDKNNFIKSTWELPVII